MSVDGGHQGLPLGQVLRQPPTVFQQQRRTDHVANRAASASVLVALMGMPVARSRMMDLIASSSGGPYRRCPDAVRWVCSRPACS